MNWNESCQTQGRAFQNSVWKFNFNLFLKPDCDKKILEISVELSLRVFLWNFQVFTKIELAKLSHLEVIKSCKPIWSK